MSHPPSWQSPRGWVRQTVRKAGILRHQEYMYERFNNYTLTRPRTKKIVGWFFVVFGFVALITPLTPGGILFFLGLEVLGVRFIGTEKVKRFFARRTPLATPETITAQTRANP